MKTVLVIDDDLGVRRLARFILNTAGYEVLLARDGSEAFDLLNADGPDVVVLDLNLPVMDGYAFLQRVDREGLQRPRVLVLTGDDVEAARRRLNADASLKKPFLPETLVAKVSELSR